MEQTNCNPNVRAPWNKGKIAGQKTPFKLKEIWPIRVRLQFVQREQLLVSLDHDTRATLHDADFAAGERLQ